MFLKNVHRNRKFLTLVEPTYTSFMSVRKLNQVVVYKSLYIVVTLPLSIAVPCGHFVSAIIAYLSLV